MDFENIDDSVLETILATRDFGCSGLASTRSIQAPSDSLLPSALGTVLAESSDSPSEFCDWRHLQRWWIVRMIYSKRQFLEKMCLFWHNHLTSNLANVANIEFMARQIDFFRQNSLGNLDAILKGITRDAAMMRYLDGHKNRSTIINGSEEGSNENYARELLELYSLGVAGGYSEADIKAAARAFSGWGIGDDGGFIYRSNQHVSESLEWAFLGQTQHWGLLADSADQSNDIIDMICKQPATPRFLARKLWRFSVGLNPSASDLQAMVDAYWSNGARGQYSVYEMMRAMFLQPRFIADDMYRSLIKSPAEYIVGIHRFTGIPEDPGTGYLFGLMDQPVLFPPSPAGWNGGPTWINSSTWFARINYANRIVTRRDQIHEQFFDVNGYVQSKGLGSFTELIDHLLSYCLDGSSHVSPAVLNRLQDYGAGGAGWSAGNPDDNPRVRGLFYLVLASAEYQAA